MGQILFDQGKVGFQKFENVKTAYDLVFASDWIKIFDSRPNLTTVEIIRHLFAHRNGFVDQTFISRARNLPLLQNVELNKQLLVDGNLAASCVDACVTAAVELLRFVDQWSCLKTVEEN
jgi:hypothetical protein